ncbi:MAG TPA: hypothetical protein VFN13_08635 [Rudaea sp.]|nr:hypothetical protein [Rudaea sp.]
MIVADCRLHMSAPVQPVWSLSTSSRKKITAVPVTGAAIWKVIFCGLAVTIHARGVTAFFSVLEKLTRSVGFGPVEPQRKTFDRHSLARI